MIEWHVQQVQQAGGMFELTMEPNNIDGIPDAILEEFALKMREYNERYGVPILLRWGHEMNGNFSIYFSQSV
jgi:hypothetical protein